MWFRHRHGQGSNPDNRRVRRLGRLRRVLDLSILAVAIATLAVVFGSSPVSGL